VNEETTMPLRAAPHVFHLVPAGRDVGLTSTALGLVRALRAAGVKVGYVKPIAQPATSAGDVDLAAHFAREVCGTATPDPIPFEVAAAQVRDGHLGDLMERVVALAEPVRAGHDVVVVEGLIPDADHEVATRLNAEIIRSLGADLLPVLAGRGVDLEGLAAKAASAVEQFGDDGRRSVAGLLINRCDPATVAALAAAGRTLVCGAAGAVPVAAAIPQDVRLEHPRVGDVAEALGFRMLRRGDADRVRLAATVLAVQSPAELIERLGPGTLVVTPADRADVLVTVALVALRGMPLAGVVFTGAGRPAPAMEAMLRSPPLDRLTLMATDDDAFTVAARLAELPRRVGRGDGDRMERAIEHVAEHVDPRPLVALSNLPVEQLMPPPVFRHRMIEKARAANRRIVLPEGEEPRTLAAAAICAQKGIARCVLIGAPAQIRDVAAAHGIDLPASVEILDPETARADYVAPMVARRRSKGLTPVQAEKALEDTVVLGTMMLAEGHVDGLVSGAVHTTADTVRPALQLVKTAPGSSIVSSVFFMLMPDQVLVYGDCAINPDPTAEELAEIAVQSADSARAFGIAPKVAMISYSTGASGKGADVDKVREATRLVKARRPDLVVDGPIQYDAASVEGVGRQKAPDSPVAGHANVFVFPDLNTGNTTYKAVQRSANVVSVGPMLQGLGKPVNDLSRGALVDDIVYTIALTAIQAAASDDGTEVRPLAAE